MNEVDTLVESPSKFKDMVDEKLTIKIQERIQNRDFPDVDKGDENE